MRRSVLAAASLLVAVAALAHPPDPSQTCTCTAARVLNGWCGRCGVGYLAALPVQSAILYEALDPHGHEVEIDTLECAGCRAAASRNGTCERHRYGFVGGQLHVTRISWLLAQGEPKRVEALGCAECRRRAQGMIDAAASGAESPGPAWCELCDAGLIGNVAFRRRDLFDAARLEHARLVRALRESTRCEYCAVAAMYDARCPQCRIRWCDGVPE